MWWPAGCADRLLLSRALLTQSALASVASLLFLQWTRLHAGPLLHLFFFPRRPRDSLCGRQSNGPPKIFLSSSLEPVNMLGYVSKGK